MYILYDNMPYEIWVKCPKCGIEKKTLDDMEKFFGTRTVNGKTIPQSHCRACRSKK